MAELGRHPCGETYQLYDLVYMQYGRGPGCISCTRQRGVGARTGVRLRVQFHFQRCGSLRLTVHRPASASSPRHRPQEWQHRHAWSAAVQRDG